MKLVEKKAEITAEALLSVGHALVLFDKRVSVADLPLGGGGKAVGRSRMDIRAALMQALKRKGKPEGELAKTPLALDLGASRTVFLALDGQALTFERHGAIRKALALLLEESPGQVVIALYGDEPWRERIGADAVYVAALNGEPLPSRKSGPAHTPLKQVTLHGAGGKAALSRALAVAEGNRLTRSLAVLPPNELSPGLYRKRIKSLAGTYGWKLREYDFAALKKMGAGAFCAVAQGSPARDAAIVRVDYDGRGKGKAVALVGKGICFDTGGHNLKPARYMHGMHEDMTGSAVVLGILAAAARLKLPVRLTGWLALAENHISPQAYRQNEVVTALNGSTIEIVHTDAEGRMVLADTLHLAAREKPQMICDFATLTGSMHYALGSRMSGVFATGSELAHRASRAAIASGERIVVFPQPTDYDEALESTVADVKQCTLEGEADHILATRFLARFVGDVPWLHMDLSSHNCKGGLGAVATDITGFGVAWGMAWLTQEA